MASGRDKRIDPAGQLFLICPRNLHDFLLANEPLLWHFPDAHCENSRTLIKGAKKNKAVICESELKH